MCLSDWCRKYLDLENKAHIQLVCCNMSRVFTTVMRDFLLCFSGLILSSRLVAYKEVRGLFDLIVVYLISLLLLLMNVFGWVIINFSSSKRIEANRVLKEMEVKT